MSDQSMFKNQRQENRVEMNLPIQLSFGSQITLQGRLKDISLKGAFVKIRDSVYMQENDELNFAIQRSSDNTEDAVHGSARISRIAKGEGIAIYFTKMDEASSTRLKKWVDLK